jgi:hypothetical protein
MNRLRPPVLPTELPLYNEEFSSPLDCLLLHAGEPPCLWISK